MESGRACVHGGVRVCTKFNTQRERESKRRYESITKHSKPRTTIRGGDIVVTQLNDSAVTG